MLKKELILNLAFILISTGLIALIFVNEDNILAIIPIIELITWSFILFISVKRFYHFLSIYIDQRSIFKPMASDKPIKTDCDN